MLCCFSIALPQEHYPEIGKPMPDFVLENVYDYPKDRVSLADLEGKYVILDFWHRYCSTCLTSFPKLNELAEKFKDRLTIFTVGMEDKKGLSNLYMQLKNRYGLKMPAVFDSTLYNRMVPGLIAPHYIWIGPDNVVEAVTGVGDVNEQHLNAFLQGKPFDFVDQSYNALSRKAAYDQYRPFMLSGNGCEGEDMTYRSLLVPYRPNEMPFVGFPTSYEQAEHLYTVFGEKIEGVISLPNLYKFGYFGRYAWTNRNPVYRELSKELVLEVDDTSKFRSDYLSGENVYWYSLVLPEDRLTADNVRKAIRSDLELNFGYSAKVVTQELPYWKVTADEGALQELSSMGEDRHWEMNDSLNVILYRNFPFDDFLNGIFYRVYQSQPPIINETGFHGNIDVIFNDALLTDFDTVRKTLEQHGIMLEKGLHPFKTLVIVDPGDG